MAEETVAQFLGRRERELIAQISALRGQLAPKEAELAHVQHMRSFLPGGSLAAGAFAPGEAPLTYPNLKVTDGTLSGSSIAEIVHASYKNKTIKELTIQALIDHFPAGATITDIHDFIRDAYGRALELASLRTQMHRLKADSILEHNPSTEIWNLNARKRQLYGMYDHPTSRGAMTELHDSPTQDDGDDSPLLKAAEKLAWDGDGSAERQPMTATERLHKLLKNANGKKE